MTAERRTVRLPAVAGTFYPADPEQLRRQIADCFAGATTRADEPKVPQALVVPHAGFVYSGPVAASAYRRIEALRDTIRRVVLLGPSHRMPLEGAGLSSADGWRTPLGTVPIDHSRDAELLRLPYVTVDDLAHDPEHSLEVQLPFLQTVLDAFVLLPIIVGWAEPEQVARIIDAAWGGPETLVVVSTDLSHYHRYDDAVDIDTRTASAIVARRYGDIGDRDACGARPLRGLLRTATDRDLEVEQIDLRNSGDTAGDRHRVVGYGAFSVA